MTVKDNPVLGRFELEEKGLIAFAIYRRDGSNFVIPHVEAPPSLRGAGTAGRLMTGIVELARDKGFKIVPTCSYARLWFRRHKDAAAVLAGLKDGTLDCIATDHAPHTMAAKAQDLAAAPSGFTGSETALPILMAMVNAGLLTISEFVTHLTVTAARVFNLPGAVWRPRTGLAGCRRPQMVNSAGARPLRAGEGRRTFALGPGRRSRPPLFEVAWICVPGGKSARTRAAEAGGSTTRSAAPI